MASAVDEFKKRVEEESSKKTPIPLKPTNAVSDFERRVAESQQRKIPVVPKTLNQDGLRIDTPILPKTLNQPGLRIDTPATPITRDQPVSRVGTPIKSDLLSSAPPSVSQTVPGTTLKTAKSPVAQYGLDYTPRTPVPPVYGPATPPVTNTSLFSAAPVDFKPTRTTVPSLSKPSTEQADNLETQAFLNQYYSNERPGFTDSLEAQAGRQRYRTEELQRQQREQEARQTSPDFYNTIDRAREDAIFMSNLLPVPDWLADFAGAKGSIAQRGTIGEFVPKNQREQIFATAGQAAQTLILSGAGEVAATKLVGQALYKSPKFILFATEYPNLAQAVATGFARTAGGATADIARGDVKGAITNAPRNVLSGGLQGALRNTSNWVSMPAIFAANTGIAAAYGADAQTAILDGAINSLFSGAEKYMSKGAIRSVKDIAVNNARATLRVRPNATQTQIDDAFEHLVKINPNKEAELSLAYYILSKGDKDRTRVIADVIRMRDNIAVKGRAQSTPDEVALNASQGTGLVSQFESPTPFTAGLISPVVDINIPATVDNFPQAKPFVSSAEPAPLQQQMESDIKQLAVYHNSKQPTAIDPENFIGRMKSESMSIISRAPVKKDGDLRLYQTGLDAAPTKGSFVDTNINEHTVRGVPEDRRLVIDIPESEVDKYLAVDTAEKAKAGIFTIKQDIPERYVSYDTKAVIPEDRRASFVFETADNDPITLAVLEAKDNVLRELENAKPGSRLFLPSGDVTGISSSFPKWLPPELRSTKLIKTVVQHINNNTIPKPSAVRQVALYNAIADRMDEVERIKRDLIGRDPVKELNLTNNAIKNEEARIEQAARTLATEEGDTGEDNTVEGILFDRADGARASRGSGYNLDVDRSNVRTAKGLKHADGTDILMGGMQYIKPLEMPEIVKLVKTLTGKYPSIKKLRGGLRGKMSPKDKSITISSEIFTEPLAAAGTLAHELGHLVDLLGGAKETMARGNLLGRLASLEKFTKDKFVNDSNSPSAKMLRQELIKLSDWWKPIPADASPSFIAYRTSSAELYADALSVLFNAPNELLERAPLFYKEFLKLIDEKPEVKEAYFAIQALLNGAPEETLNARAKDVREGFARGEDILKGLRRDRELAEKQGTFTRLRMELDDRFYPGLKKQSDLVAAGIIPSDELNLDYNLTKETLSLNDNWLLARDFDENIIKPLKSLGLTEDDLGEFLMLQRISTERAEMANPYGLTAKNATERMTQLKSRLNGDVYRKMERIAQQFHDLMFKPITESYRVGLISEDLYKNTILPNKNNYVAFRTLDHMQEFVPAGIKKQIGTFKEIANPLYATLLKGISTNYANSKQRIAKSHTDFLKNYFPEDIKRSTKVGDFFKTEPNLGRIELRENGELVSYDVDPYIAESVDTDSIAKNEVILKSLAILNNKVFKPIVLTFNLGFGLFTNPLRDIKRTYKAISRANIIPFIPSRLLTKDGPVIDTQGNMIRAYIKSLPSAIRFASGNLDAITKELIENKALSAPVEFMQVGNDASEYESILARAGLDVNGKPKSFYKKMFGVIPSGLSYAGKVTEALGKLAGYEIRVATGEKGAALYYNMRKNTSTPDYKTRGMNRWMNELLVFSNIKKEDLKSNFNLASSPTTRSGYWWKTVKANLVPKLIMGLAATGVFGVSAKRMFDKASEYDKRNYDILPLGLTESDKLAYIRIPQDDFGKGLSAMLWDIMMYQHKEDPSYLADIGKQIYDYVPYKPDSMSPFLTIPNSWLQYLQGRNPYDSYRGRLAIDQTTWDAGGADRLKAMLKLSGNQIGLTNFATYDKSGQTTLENVIQIAPLLKSMLKISDYGETEELNKVKAQEEQAQAKILLKKREYLRENIKGVDVALIKSKKRIDKIGKDIYGDTYDKSSQRAGLRLEIAKQMIKSDGISTGDAVISANTNKEKLAILKKLKETTDAEKYKKLLDLYVELKIISKDVRKKSR